MTYAVAIRLGSFALLFGVLAYWEYKFPRRPLKASKKTRWFSNLFLVILNPIVIRLIFPILAIETALMAQQQGWGLLNLFDWPWWVEFIFGVIVLDLVIYFQHVMFHALPLLWRLHMMHHSDMDIDLTTGLRFHPIEIVISMVIKITAIVALGPSVMAVLAFEIILNGLAMFNHGNIKLPLSVDQWLRRLIVTPDMHRVHHSVIIRETNSNYGFNLSLWDRLFGTYRAQPKRGHDAMTIGLAQFRDEKKLTLPWLLILPIIGDPGRQPINRH